MVIPIPMIPEGFNTTEKIIAIIITIGIILITSKLEYKRKQKEKEQWRKEWEAEQKKNQEPRPATKFMTQKEFEEWKAEKQKRDQGGFVDLDELGKLFKRRSA